MSLSLAKARVIDPILTAVAKGYESQFPLVANILFPIVPVTARGGKIITFGKEDFMLYGSQRAPGENTKRIQFGYGSGNYALVDYGLEGQVPIEVLQEGMAGPGIDHAAMAIRKVSAIMALRLEKQAADIARTAGSYAAANKNTSLASTTLWSGGAGMLGVVFGIILTLTGLVILLLAKLPWQAAKD